MAAVLVAVALAIAPAAGSAPARDNGAYSASFKLRHGDFYVQLGGQSDEDTVSLSFIRGRQIAVYETSGTFTPSSVEARFGRLGRLDLDFKRDPAGPREARNSDGVFDGTVAFTGDNGFIHLEVHPIRGSLEVLSAPPARRAGQPTLPHLPVNRPSEKEVHLEAPRPQRRRVGDLFLRCWRQDEQGHQDPELRRQLRTPRRDADPPRRLGRGGAERVRTAPRRRGTAAADRAGVPDDARPEGSGTGRVSDSVGAVSPDANGAAGAKVVVAKDLVRRYGDGDTAVFALADVSAAFDRDRFTAIMGPSGSGKSTLMHILAGLDKPTSGTVELDGVEITGLDDGELTKLRRDKLGFVFQFFNLLPVLTAEENLVLPLSIAGRKPDDAWVDQLIATVGLEDRRTHRPAELSGGQQQRVAVARALVSKPAVVFADEPTGNLDSKASADVLALLRRAVDDFRQTVVMVTHDPVAAAHADRLITLRDGRIVHDASPGTADDVIELMKRLD